MDFPTFWNTEVITMANDNVITIGRIVGAVGIFIAGWVISLIVSKLLVWRFSKSRMAKDASLVIRKVILSVMVVFVFFAALGYLNVPLTTFTFLSGAVAIGVGFGAQNIINNFISGWILLSERPVRIGDFVEIDNTQGTVEYVGNRSTRIRRVDGVQILVPNSLMLERTLVNWTLTDRNIRTKVSVGVAYGSPVRKVESLIHQAMKENSDILLDPKPSVMFENFGDSALIFDAHFWCHVIGERDLRKVRSEIRFRLDELFRDNGIVIAFPQQDVHLGPLRVQMIQPEKRDAE